MAHMRENRVTEPCRIRTEHHGCERCGRDGKFYDHPSRSWYCLGHYQQAVKAREQFQRRG